MDKIYLKELNQQKKISLVISLAILWVFLIICFSVLSFKPGLEINRYKKNDIISDNYFDRPIEWSSPESISAFSLMSGNNESDVIFEKCTVYTYDNDFNIDVKPNVNTVFQDYLGGLLQYSDIPTSNFCVDKDQIVAKKAKHTCIGKNCISIFGNKIPVGKTEEYSIACLENSNICDDLLTSISFNFSLYYPNDITERNINNTISETTLCLSVKSIIVPEEIYDSVSDFYKNTIFIKNSNIYKGDKYPAELTFESCNPLDFRQKFRVQRFTYSHPAGEDDPFFEKNSGKSNIGFFCNLIYRIGNLKLSYDKDKNNFCFIDNKETPNWLLIPELDLSPDKISTTQRYEMSNYFTNKNPHYIEARKNFGWGEKNPGFTNLIYPSSGLEVIDTTNIVNPKKGIVFGVERNYNALTTDYYWESYVNPAKDNTIFQPTLKEGNGRVYSRFRLNNNGSVVNNQTFFGTLNCRTENTRGMPSRVETTIQTVSNNQDQTRFVPSIESSKLYVGTTLFLKDGEAIWERLGLYEGIYTFLDSYFINNNGISGGPVDGISTNQNGAHSGINYITPVKGMLNFINFTDATVEGVITNSPGKFFSSIIDTHDLFGGDANGNFIINFEEEEDDSIKITSFSILDKGENNINGPIDIPILDYSLLVKNANFLNHDQSVNYIAVPNLNLNGGATFSTEDPTGGTSLTVKEVLNKGFGYQKNEKVYIVQTDYNNIILTQGLDSHIVTLQDFNNSNYSAERKKLAFIRVSELETYSGSKYSLLSGDQEPEELYNYFSNSYPFFKIKYNNVPSYLEDKVYGKSPPQIAFLGEESGEDESKTMTLAKKYLVDSDTNSGTNPESFNNFFSDNNQQGESHITNVNYIQTIQFENLNYKLENSTTTNLKNNSNYFLNPFANNLSSGAELILGKFIPYRYFNTLDGIESNSVQANKFMYNNNYAQFIPYGLKHIYEEFIDLKDLPTF